MRGEEACHSSLTKLSLSQQNPCFRDVPGEQQKQSMIPHGFRDRRAHVLRPVCHSLAHDPDLEETQDGLRAVLVFCGSTCYAATPLEFDRTYDIQIRLVRENCNLPEARTK